VCRLIIDRKKKGHYVVLGVEKTVNEDGLKRAYKKLALKVHPDKNAAPDADEAFKVRRLDRVLPISKYRMCWSICYMGVEKTVNEDGLKRAYKKLALKVHPDKNAAPDADETFKVRRLDCLGSGVRVMGSFLRGSRA
jgi:curved DNA-binding protein CbpA